MQLRMRFAERFPSEDELCNAVTQFGSWHQVVNVALCPAANVPAVAYSARAGPDLRGGGVGLGVVLPAVERFGRVEVGRVDVGGDGVAGDGGHFFSFVVVVVMPGRAAAA